MYITWGTKPYGTCDNVPDLFYVATWFFHVNHLPLVPTTTHLVLAKFGDNYHVIKIRLSLKSVFLAWTRTAAFLASAILCIMTIVALSEPHSAPARDYGPGPLAVALLFTASLYAFFMLYPRRKMPSYARACQLAHAANLTDTAWAALNVLYGKDPLDRPEPPTP